MTSPALTTLSLPAVLKYVHVLEKAGLVTTVKRSRVGRHFGQG